MKSKKLGNFINYLKILNLKIYLRRIVMIAN